MAADPLRRLLLAALLALAGCAQPPPPEPPQAGGGCGELRFEQGGRTVPSDGQSVQLERAPFVVTLLRPTREPLWLHASSGESAVAGIDRNRDPQFWLPDGHGMSAGGEDELLVTRQAQLAGDPAGQRRMADAMGAGYDVFLHEQQARHPQVRYVAALPFNWVRGRDAAGRPQLRVNQVHGEPVAQTRLRHLHLVAMTPVERQQQPGGRHSLYRVAWSACTVHFR